MTKKGFTLIELMIVISVIAILATLAFYGLSGAQKGARDTQRLSLINNMRTAMERYSADKQSYPSGANFSAVAAQLNTGGYFTSGASDPGCGNGASPIGTGTYNASNNWTPCGTVGAVTYSLSGSGASYIFIITKEGGGGATVKGLY